MTSNDEETGLVLIGELKALFKQHRLESVPSLRRVRELREFREKVAGTPFDKQTQFLEILDETITRLVAVVHTPREEVLLKMAFRTRQSNKS